MRYINVSVHDSDITIKKALNINKVPLTSGSINDIACRFSFSSAWDDYPVKVALFTGSGVAMTVAIEDNIAIIPWECLYEPGGELLVCVTGACDLPDADSFRQLNSEEVSLGVIVSGADFSDPSISNAPSPTITQQLLGKLNNVLLTEEERNKAFSNFEKRLKNVETDVDERLSNLEGDSKHSITNIYSENGAHNFRINNNSFEYFDGENWIPIHLKDNYKTMTVIIDLSDSNPDTCITYTDDAVNMTPGDNSWDSFFGHYPVMLRNKTEYTRLDPYAFNYSPDFQDCILTDPATDDICIAYPRRGLKIKRYGNKISVSMTDHPNLNGYNYNAHQVFNSDKDIFYVGAFKSDIFLNNNGVPILTSLPDTEVAKFNNYSQAKEYAENKGALLFSHYQRLFIQCMFLLKYKSLDSQNIIGYGINIPPNDPYAPLMTGSTIMNGMDSEFINKIDKTSGLISSKLFGLEDIWGGIYEWLDGIYIENDKVYTSKACDFYEHTTDVASMVGGYISNVEATNELGFIPSEFNASTSTYFNDWGYIRSNGRCIVGGNFDGGLGAGLFCVRLGENELEEYSSFDKGARLMYI